MLTKIKFKIPIQINNIVGKKENFKPGVYDLDDSLIDHWFIQGLIADGKAEVLESAIEPAPLKKEESEAIEEVKVIAIEKKDDPSLKFDVEVEEIKSEELVKNSIAAPPEIKPIKKRRLKRR